MPISAELQDESSEILDQYVTLLKPFTDKVRALSRIKGGDVECIVILNRLKNLIEGLETVY